MNNILHCITLTIALLSMLLPIASSASNNISLGAHVHGLSEITIAIENQTMEIEIQSPAINIVGFEHQAETSEDIATVKKAEHLLRDHNAIFSFNGGHCQLQKQSIDMSNLLKQHHQEAKNHKLENKHKQSHSHGHTELKEHVDENHSDKDIKETNASTKNPHSEVTAHYFYSCTQALTLSSVTINAFGVFPSIHKIQAMWIHKNEQGAAILTPKNSTINFKN